MRSIKAWSPVLRQPANQASGTACRGFWTTIGEATLKYHAWGDGYETSTLVVHDEGFTVWYASDGAVVGVLTHNADDDYDRGEELIRRRAPVPR